MIDSATHDRAIALMDNTTALTGPDGARRYWGFNGGGPASTESKDHLRSLLRRHTGNPDAEAIRRYLNDRRASGDLICRSDVSAAIEALQKL